ncbi:sigma-70 family RNA polymerase sigma factor [Tissierella sp.]|uniref:RNA polymerase sigma factor n=1 Tax=Tissierella sp. TaxID=41274 RepID=UPI0028576141|nr:sigma-70 family RNA polymerase sigma factor [Tissierella sp.]MDR7856835.1 sigma-70 family RNA polymerase sigma factor [Tissierella sp.]
MINESVLIKKALDGDQDSFAKIVDLYKNYVFAIILNFIKDYNEVENVAQEVFLQIYLSLPKYQEDNFKGWIGRIASNKSIDWLRKKKSKFKEEVFENGEELINSPKLRHDDSPEEILIQKEKKESIAKLCKSVPQIYEEVIVKFYLQGKSYEEIAEEEEVSVKTIASRLYRGRNMLKEKWREENETL